MSEATQFIHYSKKPLTTVRSVRVSNSRDRWDKPHGLWFSAGKGQDSWKAWCQAEDFALDRLAHATEIRFHKDARILLLDSPTAIDKFTDRHGMVPDSLRHPTFGNPEDYKGHQIDWQSVADEHQAIVIAPYIWERRMTRHTFWYYSWDCASGVVWDADAIKSLKPLSGAP